jgi:hypothetical protein
VNPPDSNLIDIVPPAPPPALQHEPPFAAAGAVVALALVAIALAWWFRGRKKRQALKRLRRLKQALRDGSLAQHELAYLLAAELRGSFGLNRLGAAPAPACVGAARQEAWAHFTERLNALRYRPDHALERRDAEQLVADAELLVECSR